MKTFSFFTLVTIACMAPIVSASAEREASNNQPRTKLEAFLLENGQIIIKDYYALGKISGLYGSDIEIKALVTYEQGKEDQRLKGFQIDVHERGRHERSETLYLDREEIEALSQAIEYMIHVSAKWKTVRKNNTEVVFSTKDTFKIGFYQKGFVWQGFSSTGNTGEAICQFNSPEEFRSIKALADSGLELLKQK
ncbi:MAG: hypothetical protein MRJ65_10515 [Candidatus Brocadiaceae bacterium]|nr:hypothetical protein [Candidatus Brocadiaceae bacterium]